LFSLTYGTNMHIIFLLCLSFFFFQAEDGIRDFHVTGVQTCALPILFDYPHALYAAPSYIARHGRPETLADLAAHHLIVGEDRFRSEERRVGKECRSREATKQ